MAEIRKKLVREVAPGDAIIESMGRILFRLPNEALSPIARLGGLVAVCDTSGNRMAVSGDIVVTSVNLDPFDNAIGYTDDGSPGFITLPRWQASVN